MLIHDKNLKKKKLEKLPQSDKGHLTCYQIPSNYILNSFRMNLE